MYLALVYYPEIQLDDLQSLRNRYDPYAQLMRAHLPFVFPVEEQIGKTEFEAHIRSVLGRWKPFDVHLCKLEKTPDHWLMLTPKEGKDEAIRLHDALYSGFLEPFLRKDLPFLPHVSLGHFGIESWELGDPLKKIALDETAYENALSELKSRKLDLWRRIDRLTIVGLNDSLTKCTDIITLPLGT